MNRVTHTLSFAGKNSHFGAIENNTQAQLLSSSVIIMSIASLLMVMVHLWPLIPLKPVLLRSLGGLLEKGWGLTQAASPPLLQASESAC